MAGACRFPTRCWGMLCACVGGRGRSSRCGTSQAQCSEIHAVVEAVGLAADARREELLCGGVAERDQCCGSAREVGGELAVGDVALGPVSLAVAAG